MNAAFAGKVAVITGGAHGIGKAIAEAFRAEGAAAEIIDIAPGGHCAGDISKKETLQAFAQENCNKKHRIRWQKIKCVSRSVRKNSLSRLRESRKMGKLKGKSDKDTKKKRATR